MKPHAFSPGCPCEECRADLAFKMKEKRFEAGRWDGDDYVWYGAKRGGRFRHVRPNGQRVDNFCGWICTTCWRYDVLVKEPQKPHRCRNWNDPAHLEHNFASLPELTMLLPLLRMAEISNEVAEAILRFGGGPALGDAIKEALGASSPR